jgi:HNH endonuclease
VISTARLRECLRYEPDTGALIWLVRSCDDRHTKQWNTRYAGKRAGTIDKDGYRVLAIDRRKYRAARVIWQIKTGAPPPFLVDHENTDPADDRWSNLRLATPKQSAGNTKRRGGASGVKGVKILRSGRYAARFGNLHLGIFDTPEEAHAAYMTAAREAYGEFARGQ